MSIYDDYMLTQEVLLQQALQHPLPWIVDFDRTFEVRASDGYCVAECREFADAERLIEITEGVVRRATKIKPGPHLKAVPESDMRWSNGNGSGG